MSIDNLTREDFYSDGAWAEYLETRHIPGKTYIIKPPPVKHFMITGLPRTRSSWFANLFTYGDNYCRHELSNNGCNVKALAQVLKAHGYAYTGTADCVGMFYYESLRDEIDAAVPLVIIERDPGEVLQSLHNIYKKDFHEGIEKSLLQIEYLKKYFNPLVVEFEELNSFKVINKIWRHCVGGPFETNRFLMLDRMKIEPYQDKYMKWVDPNNAIALMHIPRKRDR